ncbi:hypothetical protein Y032_0117g667 [Ancylostoma ceylanicum]|uniref:Uncharacterized protein n=1 Tax=Ancylostoma ceylanicum TaxID=53326 RepID=A0A016TC29_9BILA|nr:hypothetical protein Y032_0117g667 [Ancylostoma ceylanicum]
MLITQPPSSRFALSADRVRDILNSNVLHFPEYRAYLGHCYKLRCPTFSDCSAITVNHPRSKTHLLCRAASPTIPLEKDGLRDCTIATGPKRGMLRKHALSERVEQVPPRFCSRDAKIPHARTVYLSESMMMHR